MRTKYSRVVNFFIENKYDPRGCHPALQELQVGIDFCGFGTEEREKYQF